MANKNSTYVQSLVSFILDTKPYHSKLTEVVEEYRFADEMTVKIVDNWFNAVTTKAAWMYSHFASGISAPAPTTLIHRLVSPQFRGMPLNSSADNKGAFKIGRDENTDLPLVPLAFDPTCIQGVGIADSFVQRNGNGANSEPMTEGHDVFLSHGAFVAQVNQTFNTLNDYSPTFTERRNEGVFAHATATVQALALDTTNPSSAINKIQALLDEISAQLELYPNQGAIDEVANIQAILDTVTLPNSYEALMNSLIGTPVIDGYDSWDDVAKMFSAYSPSLYFNAYTDVGARESGYLAYDSVTDDDHATVKNIAPVLTRPNYDEITIRGVTATTYFVYGSHSGLIGSGTFPGQFTSNSISFTMGLPFEQTFTAADGPYPVTVTVPFSGSNFTIIGDAIQISSTEIEVQSEGVVRVGLSLANHDIVLTPSAKMTVHKNAPLEAWSIIKVNPLAYSRPVLNSARYGYIRNLAGDRNVITVIDQSFNSGVLVIRALNESQFSVSHTGDPLYHQIVTVGVPFNDGRIAFTIVAGTVYTYQAGDAFYVPIENEDPKVFNLDLYYGYDMDPYDGGNTYPYSVLSSSPDWMRSLDFNYDSRFVNYDFTLFDLQISQSAVDGREWRLRAIPNIAKPLVQRGSTDNRINESGDEGAPIYDRDGDGLVDIRMYYADNFALEFHDANSPTWSFVALVPVGTSYSNATHGLSFNLLEADKPFVSGIVTGAGNEYEGGDVIYWSIQNKGPEQTEAASLVSFRTPRLVIHGDSYHTSTPAKWTLTWSAPKVYSLQGFYSTGSSAGSPVFSTPISVNVTNEGRSFVNKEHGLHWTVKEGIFGLAANDSMSFETFEDKPIFLVHGSVSGWQENADVDKYYWNGMIGFKIAAPSATLFEDDLIVEGENSWVTSLGTVTCSRIRKDTDAAVYTMRGANGFWTLYRDGTVTANGSSVLEDKYVTFSMPPAPTAAIYLKVNISVDPIEFTMGHDLAIVRTNDGRAPGTGDFVVFKRTKQDELKISIRPKDDDHAAVLAELNPETIDIRYVDHNTGSGVPLNVTSPETAILPGWIPALTTVFDVAPSIAEFSDPATSYEVQAAATGEKIGTVASIGATPVEPVYFTWDSAFAEKYLPLNAEASIVTYGSGMNDLVRANMKESLTMLISGGGLVDDALFRDEINVQVLEDNQWLIKSSYLADVSVLVKDGPFGGFLPGYDNLPYDAEDGADGYYDAGQAFVDYFQRAKELALQNVLTPQEQAEYNDLVGLIGAYTSNPASVTLDEFIAMLDAEPPINSLANATFGTPSVGMGMNIDKTNSQLASTNIADAMAIDVQEFSRTFDEYGYDVGGLDLWSDVAKLFYPSTGPALPAAGMPGFGVLYEDFETPLYVENPARVLEVFFPTAISTPQFFIWKPEDPAPVPVTIVERLTAKSFRFSIPSSSELKLIVL